MKSTFRSHGFSILGIAIVLGLCGVGTFRAFTRGANDFSVFYEAWKLVLLGRGSEVYRVSPDRFLYSPGFAWLLSPLGFFSKNIALGIWCVLKIFLVGFLIKIMSQALANDKKLDLTTVGISAWGVVLVARPLLIDFEYGQVNLLILGACLWGLIGHFEKKSSIIGDCCRWGILTFAAIAKLFPLPLLIVPWAVNQGISKQKMRVEKVAVVLGAAIIFLFPFLNQGWGGTYQLMMDWRDALFARGLPLESHNQSFTALLHHYLSGNPTPVLSEGSQLLFFGHPWLSLHQIALLSIAWTLTTTGIILGWIVSGAMHSPLRWIAVLIGLLIVPSHLIWKPYFVMSMPLAILILHDMSESKSIHSFFIVFLLFAGINLTTFDFVGHHWAPHFEAASILLLTHLVMLIKAAK